MQTTYRYCAGIDVQKQTVVVCYLSADGKENLSRETHTYGATTDGTTKDECLACKRWHHADCDGKYWGIKG